MDTQNEDANEESQKQQNQCSICFKEFESTLSLDTHYNICKKKITM